MKFIQKCITNRSLLYINRCISSISDSNNKQLYHILGTKYNIRGISTVHKGTTCKPEFDNRNVIYYHEYNYILFKIAHTHIYIYIYIYTGTISIKFIELN